MSSSVTVGVVGHGRHADMFAAEVDSARSLRLQRADIGADLGVPTATGLAIIAGAVDRRLDDAQAAANSGWNVVVTAPIAQQMADADSLVALAASAHRPVTFGEPLCSSPVTVAIANRVVDAAVDRGSVWMRRPSDTDDDLHSLDVRAVAFVLSIIMPIWGTPDLDLCRERQLVWPDGRSIDVTTEMIGPGQAATVGCQFAGRDVAVTAEVWPACDVSVNGSSQPLRLDRPQDALGYAPMLRHAVDIASGRGGALSPMGFGRLVLDAARRLRT